MDKNTNKNIKSGVSLFGAKSQVQPKPLLKPNLGGLFVHKPQVKKQQQKMINDFDSDLILENIDKKVKNKAVKVNIKINTLERNLLRIKEELDLLNLLNLEKDIKRRDELSNFKNYLETQLNQLKAEKKKFGVWYFLAGFFVDKVDKEALLRSVEALKAEIKKCDKVASSLFKHNNGGSVPFKW